MPSSTLILVYSNIINFIPIFFIKPTQPINLIKIFNRCPALVENQWRYYFRGYKG